MSDRGRMLMCFGLMKAGFLSIDCSNDHAKQPTPIWGRGNIDGNIDRFRRGCYGAGSRSSTWQIITLEICQEDPFSARCQVCMCHWAASRRHWDNTLAKCHYSHRWLFSYPLLLFFLFWFVCFSLVNGQARFGVGGRGFFSWHTVNNCEYFALVCVIIPIVSDRAQFCKARKGGKNVYNKSIDIHPISNREVLWHGSCVRREEWLASTGINEKC